MTDSTKSVHCVRDLRDVPATAYRLPTDGRTWLYNCRRRQHLALLLATYANGDGSNARPSRKSMANLLSCSVRTVQTLLNDLAALGLQREVGLHGESGPAVRQLDVAALRAGAQSSSEQECRVQEEECKVQKQECRVQEEECSLGLHTTVQVLDRPSKPSTNRPASSQNELAGWEGWLLLPTTTDLMGIPSDNEQRELRALASKELNRFEYLKKAVRKFRDREQGFDGLKKVSPWRLFLSQSETAMAVAKKECLDSHEWCLEHVPGHREASDASIARQIEENMRGKTVAPIVNEEDPNDFFGN